MGAQPSVPTRQEIDKLMGGKKRPSNGRVITHGPHRVASKPRAKQRARVG
jgi:hypothetical protein